MVFDAPDMAALLLVSMKSGLEGRNNPRSNLRRQSAIVRLNEVRPRRPEQ